MGKGLLIIILGGIGIFGWINSNNNNRITAGTELAIKSFSENKVRNICNSAAEVLLTKLGNDNTFRAPSETSSEWFDGNITYKVSDTVIAADSLVKIKVKADYFNSIKSVTVIAWLPSSGYEPDIVKGAINANNDVYGLGTLTIDGRDHELNGSIIANKGKYGVWTTGSFTQGGAVDIGGTNDADVDYVPSSPGNTSIIKTNQTWIGPYPNSPDKVLGGAKYGFPEGKLKSIAQSGANGSQYVTNPSSLTYPLKGITYVEAASWNPAHIDGFGILILHNGTLTAILKNALGSFKGLVIADDVDKFKGAILGAIFVLTPSPATGNSIGNGTGDLIYSSKTIKKATKYVEKLQSGFGKHRVKIISWLE